MSKRAETAAIKALPDYSPDGKTKVDLTLDRLLYQHGYEQAEKDTIERAIEWLKVHAKDYIVNMTGSYPDAPFDAIIGGECWDELKKAMENNG